MEPEKHWNIGIMGRKMNDKNPTFQYSIIPAFQSVCFRGEFP
jgi:hypothetical protein